MGTKVGRREGEIALPRSSPNHASGQKPFLCFSGSIFDRPLPQKTPLSEEVLSCHRPLGSESLIFGADPLSDPRQKNFRPAGQFTWRKPAVRPADLGPKKPKTPGSAIDFRPSEHL